LPVSPPRKRTKTSSSTPNLKSPSIRTPSLLKKSLSMVFLFVHLQILPNSLLYGQKKKDRQYNGQKKKYRQYNGQKKDRQDNGQRKKDIQHNDQKKKDRQYNGKKSIENFRIQGKEDRGTDIDSLQKNISI
jgi:hypothetical protein